ncbi:arsinothricin resistance N-acetyltransferase ArsN1 family B [Luteimonas suaedae]|uniref:arsinothricin resistance N-acetyltransferase ArsN1 family B n=1 Tax=Luteimonas suaedae TaxID=2605430 RepID=UPI0011F01CAE|nr:arsinothricin resistance N-acetyltransferase ArsN1 family B [Luteimonas suaedae]
MQPVIRPAMPGDAEAIARIYNHYVADTCVTFETEPLSGAEMAQRIADTLELPLPWLVADADGAIAGYAYASKWKGRCAYRYSVETTVYLDPLSTGQGLGRRLYVALIDAVKAQGMRTAIGGIALPNAASIALHERLGFRKVGHFEQVGFKQDRWIDVGYWQRLL